MRRRDDVIHEIERASRQHYAAYVLFNQALATKLELHPTDLQVLSLWSLHPEPKSVRQIAALAGLTSGSATRLVDRLVRSGIARREPNPEDARALRVTLTAAVDTVSREWQQPGDAFGHALESFDDEQLHTILDYLTVTTEVGRTQTQRIAPHSPR